MPILHVKLEQWSATAFYIAGGLLIFHALNLIALLAGLNLRIIAYINFVAIGHIIAIVGMFGLYATLAEKAPGLSRIGAIFLGIAAICSVGNQVVMLGNNLFQLPGFMLPQGYIWVNYITQFVGFLLFAIAVLRTDSYPKPLGFALFAFTALIAIGAVQLFFMQYLAYSTWISLLIIVMQAGVVGALGYVLENPDRFADARIAVT